MPLGLAGGDGMTHDAITVETSGMAMESKYGKANRVRVMDRGMVSRDNVQFIRQRGGSYIVGTPKAMLRQFEQYLRDRDWREVQEGVEVKLVPGPQGDELFVLARSVDRRKKEQAMQETRFRSKHEGEKQQQGGENGAGESDFRPFQVSCVSGVLLLEFVIIVIYVGLVPWAQTELNEDIPRDGYHKQR